MSFRARSPPPRRRKAASSATRSANPWRNLARHCLALEHFRTPERTRSLVPRARQRLTRRRTRMTGTPGTLDLRQHRNGRSG